MHRVSRYALFIKLAVAFLFALSIAISLGSSYPPLIDRATLSDLPSILP